MDEFLSLQRFEYEEPYHTEIHLRSSNGLFTGCLEYYCNVNELDDIGKKLKSFPSNFSDKIVYELGSEDPKERCAYYFRLHVSVIDRSGHCAVQIRINRNSSVPNNGLADFTIKANPADLNNLGELFLRLSKFEIREFTWRPTQGRT